MKNKKIILISIILIICIIICIIYIMRLNKEPANEIINNNSDDVVEDEDIYDTEMIHSAISAIEEDGKSFKTEYESYNGVKIEDSDDVYSNVSIDEDNPIIYVSLKQLVDIINSDEEAYIFIGAATCKYCRAIIEPVLKAFKDLNVNVLYYYDLDKTEKGLTEEEYQQYENMLSEIGIVEKDDDDSILWKLPTIIKTQAGKILVENPKKSISQEDNQSLSDEQKEEIYNIYYNEFK